MNRNLTFICDRCTKVAVVVAENGTLLCGECFLEATVKKMRETRKQRPQKHAA